MAYRLTKTFNNGYNCCCKQTWDDDGEWYDTLDEALEAIPTDPWDEFEGFMLEDGSTGEEIGEGTVTALGRTYHTMRYHGYLPSGSFDRVYVGGKRIDKTWSVVLSEHQAARDEENRQRKLRELERLKIELGVA